MSLDETKQEHVFDIQVWYHTKNCPVVVIVQADHTIWLCVAILRSFDFEIVHDTVLH